MNAMWIALNSLLIALLMLGMQSVESAPSLATNEWQQDGGRVLVERAEYVAELYDMLQTCLNVVHQQAPRHMINNAKRNSEIINSLLALPKSMADVGR